MTTPITGQAAKKVDFQQFLDRKREHALLSADPAAEGMLRYQYLDTGQIVTVPNIWYNQTQASRIAAILYQAEACDRRASDLERAPVKSLSAADNQKLVERYRRQAQTLRMDAEKLKAEG